MKHLSSEIGVMKKKYREIFLQTSNEFCRKMKGMTPNEFKEYINSGVEKEISEMNEKISNTRKDFSCQRCCVCCKLACSEFSPEELEEKARMGDNYATQFLSRFIPYENIEDAKKIFPDYFDLLNNEIPNEQVYFYHCPNVDDEKGCPDYENRPQICKDFPDNPISFLPDTCGYKQWKEAVEVGALRLYALL